MSSAEDRVHRYGVHKALVTDVRDPDERGRVKVKLIGLADAEGRPLEEWARVATLMAGRKSGTWFLPDTGNEVLVAFEAGDPRRPCVVGALWGDDPPERMDAAGSNHRKLLRTRNGIRVTVDDQDGKETLTLETPGGQKVRLEDGPASIEIADGNGNSIRLDAGGVTVTASAKVSIVASTVAVSAGMLTVDAGMSTFSGVVKADTVIANSVVSASYTPGAGNLM
jgi:uncharacterized protein involved in type VI secretion and phage assembly